MNADPIPRVGRPALRFALVASGVAAAVLLVRGFGAEAAGVGEAAPRAEEPAPPLELPGFQRRAASTGGAIAAAPRTGRGSGIAGAAERASEGAPAPGAGRDAPPHEAESPDPGPSALSVSEAGGPARESTGRGGAVPARLDLDVAELRRGVETDIANALAAAKKARKGKFDVNETTIAVAVVDAATGDVLVDRLGRRALRPASNLKVVTAAAALLGLGLDAEFETRIEAHGKLEGGVLDGDLVVRAGADPLHRREGDGSVLPLLEPAAKAVRAAGIQRVRGRVVLDEGSYGTPGPAPAWPDESQWWTDYCGLAGGFSANGGVFRATVTATSLRRPARLTLRPRAHGLDENLGVQVRKGKLDVRVGATATTVTVKGSVPKLDEPWVKEFRHPDPVDLFGHSFLAALDEAGVRADRFERERSVLPAGPPLYTLRTPIRSVLPAVLLDSNNPVTDQLFFLVGDRLGGAGTRAKSAAAIAKLLTDSGVDASALAQVDGSGLSRDTRVSARLLVDTLRALRKSSPEGWRVFSDALPVAGRTGSLAGRMRGTSAEGVVRGKTGWIAGVSALSGVVLDGRGDPRLAYAILVNYPRVGGLNNAAWKPMQNRICARLASAVREPAGAGR
ncbi:MAG: D-alanyl-D-alanine carboxypeptidase/D-alanyl-D-alanine-endopeptidase [Planctomycetota bacterium]